MRAWIEKVYWWWMLRFSNTERIGGIPFLYISAANHYPCAEIRAVLSDAMSRITSARGGFGELVKDHLHFIAALDAPSPVALVYARGYVSPFSGQEGQNPHFLACRIIWAATYIRLAHNARAHGQPRDVKAIRAAGREAQLRFTKQFPDAAEWVQFLERYPGN